MAVETPLVMIWRQVSDLAAARNVGEGMLHLPMIGEDEDSSMYDAGSVILGFFAQREFRQKQQEVSETLAGADEVALHNAARLRVANQCSGLNFSRVDLVVNPA